MPDNQGEQQPVWQFNEEIYTTRKLGTSTDKRESSMEMLFIKIAKPRFYELMCAGIRNNDNLNKTNFSKA